MTDLVLDLLEASEEHVDIIIDAGIAYQVGMELLDNGIELVEVDKEELRELYRDSDILSVAKNVYEDGRVEYFVQEVFTEDGKTLYSESNVFYIDSEIVEEIDLDKLVGEIIIFELEDDELDEEDEVIEEIADDILEDLINNEDEECPHCIVKSYLEELYDIAYEDALADIRDGLNEALEV